MDSNRFDTLTRVFASRRTALIGAFGGIGALLGLPAADAGAHNPVRACRRIKNPKRRRACLRRARAHNRKHRNRKHRCKPQPKAVTCASRCGPVRDNCRKQVNCTCPANQPCDLGSGTCICLIDGQTCTSAPQCCQDPIPTSCAHSGTDVGEFNGPTRCCRSRGLECTSLLGCCAVDEGLGTFLVNCSPSGICGGPGAQCSGGAACASGTCTAFVCE